MSKCVPLESHLALVLLEFLLEVDDVLLVFALLLLDMLLL